MVFDTQNLSPKPWNITQCRNYLFSNLIRTPQKKHAVITVFIDLQIFIYRKIYKNYTKIPIEPKKKEWTKQNKAK